MLHFFGIWIILMWVTVCVLPARPVPAGRCWMLLLTHGLSKWAVSWKFKSWELPKKWLKHEHNPSKCQNKVINNTGSTKGGKDGQIFLTVFQSLFVCDVWNNALETHFSDTNSKLWYCHSQLIQSEVPSQIERFSYDLEMKTREQNRNNKRTEIVQFNWFIERIWQTRLVTLVG